MRRWGIDLAFSAALSADHWQSMKDNGLSFAIFRASQRDTIRDDPSKQVAFAKQFGIPYGFYSWFEPGVDPIRQVDNMLSVASRFLPKCLFADFEQREERWNYDRGPYMTAAQIDDAYHQMITYLHGQTTIPVGVYSGSWFINQYAPGMLKWIGEYPYWEASYRKFNPTTWQEFAAQIAMRIMPSYPGYPIIGAWQFAGDNYTQLLPGHGMDYDLVDDDAVFAHLFQGAAQPPTPKPIEPPAPTTRYVVINLYGLYVRSTPDARDSSNKLKWLPKDYPLDVVSIKDGWAKVLPTGYVNASDKYIKAARE